MNRIHPRPRKKLELRVERSFLDKTPRLYFQVQKVFQDFGVVLMDLKTGIPIFGQVAMENIGLVDSGKKRPAKKQMGFIKTPPSDNKNFRGTDIDALLSFDGNMGPDMPIFQLRVIDGRELAQWQELAYNVVRQFSRPYKGQRMVPDINFDITALTNPGDKDPRSAIEAVLRRIQEYGFEDSQAISHFRLESEEDIFLDEEDEDRNE